jgi:hypothetical protein
MKELFIVSREFLGTATQLGRENRTSLSLAQAVPRSMEDIGFSDHTTSEKVRSIRRK